MDRVYEKRRRLLPRRSPDRHTFGTIDITCEVEPHHQYPITEGYFPRTAYDGAAPSAAPKRRGVRHQESCVSRLGREHQPLHLDSHSSNVLRKRNIGRPLSRGRLAFHFLLKLFLARILASAGT